MITALRWIIGILALVMHEVLQEVGFIAWGIGLCLLAGGKEKQEQCYLINPHFTFSQA